MSSTTVEHIHRDDEASKIGMWIFIFTELILFGGLFVVYAVYRYIHPDAFHLAAEQLDTTLGTINTAILLVSSASIAMATSAIKLKNKKMTLGLIGVTMLFALIFMVNKYFEWGAKISHGLYPGSDLMQEISHGEVLFYGLYFFMTGLHAFHIIVGLIFMAIVFLDVVNNRITPDDNMVLENCGLYWHLVDLIWIFLFPLFYLIL